VLVTHRTSVAVEHYNSQSDLRLNGNDFEAGLGSQTPFTYSGVPSRQVEEVRAFSVRLLFLNQTLCRTASLSYNQLQFVSHGAAVMQADLPRKVRAFNQQLQSI
jgi:hypothetical protein